ALHSAGRPHRPHRRGHQGRSRNDPRRDVRRRSGAASQGRVRPCRFHRVGGVTMTKSLNETAAANIQTGVLLFVKEALCTAMFDRRLDRGHRLVLGAIAMHINGTTAKAWPGRDILAQITGLSPKTVSNSIAELAFMGYLIRDRENVPEANNRKLTVYT